MDFSLSEDEERVRSTVRAFARKELVQEAARWDREGVTPDDAVVQKMVALGLVGMCLPEQYGGGGQSLIMGILAIEQLAAVSPLAAAPVFESNVGPVRVIEFFGDEEQKKRWLPEVAKGRLQISVGMTEPAAGSALTDLQTRAEVTSGGIKLNGRKCFVTGGGHSGAYLVYCRFDDVRGAPGIGAVLVEKGTPGFSFGKQERFMGMRGFPSADLVFEDCVVPKENLVVPAGGFGALMQCFDIERIGNSTMALGLATGALEFALDYAKQRHTFGKPICDRQAIQLNAADMAIKVESARLLVYRAAVNAGRGVPVIQEASMAKVAANEAAKVVTDMAVEMLGGYGYSAEFPVERMLRDSRGWAIAGGTLQMQKIIIAATLFQRRFNQYK